MMPRISSDSRYLQPVEKLTTLLDIRLIFLSEISIQEEATPLLTVILPEKATSPILELAAVLARQLQEESGCVYRIFTLDYARQQVLECNLFFLQACSVDSLIYSGRANEGWRGWRPDSQDVCTAEAAFREDMERISAFSQGAAFFASRGILPQATFMLHQSVELLYRSAELFLMGKERKTHSIKEHQYHIRKFSPELGRIWEPEQAEAIELLSQLDAAYIQARYHQGFTIDAGQYEALRLSSDRVSAEVTQLFQEAVAQCRQQTPDEKGGNDAPRERVIQNTYEGDSLERIRALADTHFRMLEPYLPEKGLQSIPLPTSGYQEASFLASHLLKVCMLALEADPADRIHIPEPNKNIREVLGIIPHLLPHEELEFLDTLREWLDGEAGAP